MASTHRLLGPALLLLALAGLTLNAVPLLSARMAATPPVRLELLGQVGGTAYDVVVDGDVAYLLQGPRVLAVDLADPAAPRVLGQSEVLGGIAEAGAVYRDHLYVCLRVTEARGALAVLNVAEPGRPVTVGTTELSDLPRDVAVSSGVAYLAIASANQAGGLLAMDVGDPAAPRLLARLGLQDPSEALALAGHRGYVLGGSYMAGSLRVIDLSDPAAPRRVSSVALPPAGPRPRSIAVGDGHLLVPLDTGELRVFSLADPDQPRSLADLGATQGIEGARRVSTGSDDWVAVSGSVGPVAGRLADLLAGGKAAGTVEWPAAIGLAWQGANLVVTGADQGGLGVFAARGPVLERRGALMELGGVDQVALHRRSAYLSRSADHALARIDLSDPTRPRLADRYPMEPSDGCLAVSGDTLYAGRFGQRGEDGLLAAYALGTNGAPREAGRVATSGGRFLLLGERAYVGGWHRLDAVDIGNPAALRVTATITRATGVGGLLAASGDRLYATGGDSLQTIDISRPDQPAFLATTGLYQIAAGLGARGDRVLLSSAGAALFPDPFRGLVVYDVGDPTQARQVGSLALPEDVWPGPVLVDGDQAVLAASDGLRVLDVSADQPAQLDWLPLAGPATSLIRQGDLLAAGRGDGGLVIVRVVPAGVPTSTPTTTIQPPPTRTASPTPPATAAVPGHAAYLPRLVRDEPKLGPTELTEEYQLDGLSWDLAVDGDLVYAGLGPHIATWRLGDAGSNLLGRGPRLGGDAHGLAPRGRLLYVAASDGGLVVLDVQQAAMPVLLGAVRLPAPAVDVAVIGTTAYVAAGDAGVQAVDVVDPRHPRVIGAFEGPVLPRSVVAVGDRTVYVLDSRWRSDLGEYEGGLWVVDVSDPSRPRGAGHLGVTGLNLQLDGSWLYVGGDPRLARVDVSMPRAPGPVEPLELGSGPGFAVRGDLVWTISGPWVEAWNLADPHTLLGSLDIGPLATAGRAVLAGDRLLWVVPAYAAIELPGRSGWPGYGVGAAAIGNPEAMRLLGHVTPLGLNDGDCTPYLGQMVCEDIVWGLRRLDLADPATATTVRTYALPPRGPGASALASQGDTLFMYGTDAEGGSTAPRQSDYHFRVLRLREPGQVEMLGSVDVAQSPFIRKLVVDGATAYGLTDLEGGLFTFDVTDPARPRVLGPSPRLPKLTDLAVRDGVGLGAVEGGLVILDLSTPPEAIELATVRLPFTPHGVLLDGDRAYAAGYDGLAALDLTDPRRPSRLGQAAEPAMPGTGLRLHGQRLYIYGYNGGVAVHDVSDPTTLRRVATWPSPATSQPDPDVIVDGLWPTDGAVYVSVRSETSESVADITLALSPPP